MSKLGWISLRGVSVSKGTPRSFASRGDAVFDVKDDDAIFLFVPFSFPM
jgi:hypothetical protein